MQHSADGLEVRDGSAQRISGPDRGGGDPAVSGAFDIYSRLLGEAIVSLAAMVGVSLARSSTSYTRGVVRLCQGALDEDLTPGPADRNASRRLHRCNGAACPSPCAPTRRNRRPESDTDAARRSLGRWPSRSQSRPARVDSASRHLPVLGEPRQEPPNEQQPVYTEAASTSGYAAAPSTLKPPKRHSIRTTTRSVSCARSQGRPDTRIHQAP